MFSHIMIGGNDLEASRAFYDATLGTLGCPPGEADTKGRLFYVHSGGRLIVGHPINGKPATPANGGTIGFAANSPDAVEAWHKAGLANGGTAIENPPGPRESPIGTLYLAYLRDPAGNKLCALHHMG